MESQASTSQAGVQKVQEHMTLNMHHGQGAGVENTRENVIAVADKVVLGILDG